MPTFRHPVLICHDASGACAAALVGDCESAAATGPTELEAIEQLKELLVWRRENEPWNADPDFTETVLQFFDVDVRPQYRARQRLIPCRETVRMRVPCVTGRQASGLRLCVVPHLAVQFNFQETSDLKSLVTHYVKEELQGLSPSDLAANLPPRECRLDEIVIKVGPSTSRRIAPESRRRLEVLSTVADSLFAGPGRQRLASTAYGRESLVESVATGIGEQRANLLLIGDAGSGKSTILNAAARRLIRRKSDGDGGDDGDSDEVRQPRFWRTSAGRLVAGMRYLGEWEERCEEFVEQLEGIDGVLFVENLLELISVGGTGPGDSVGAFLLPYLQRGELRIASEATPAEVEACRRLLPGLLDLFRLVPIPAFDDAQAAQVLGRIASNHSTTSKLTLEPEAIPLAQRLFKRFQPYLAFPGPAADFVRALCERKAPPGQGTPSPSIGVNEVVTAFVRRTGLPESLLRDEIPLSLAVVRERFAGRIIGQPAAADAAARIVTSIKAGMTDPLRPQSVVLLCGPTGVGKTSMARELVEFCFGAGGEKDRLVRLDMSEYGGRGAAVRLVHDGRGAPAAWIERVRRQPFCLVLFDEIEKAAPEVFDVLLSLLDEGRLTDRFGRVTWFRCAIIVLTSNLGANAAEIGGFSDSPPSGHESEVARFFRPEFFNRLDAVVTFKALAPADVESIVRKELAELSEREGLAGARLKLEWTDDLVTLIGREGYDRSLGARPLQRAIERRVVTPLARWKLAHPGARDTVVRLGLAPDATVTPSNPGAWSVTVTSELRTPAASTL